MLTLNIPDKDAALQHAVETRPKAVADWLGRLPFASPEGTAQQLLVALYALNRHPLGEDDRYTLMALYRPVIERAASSLESLLADAGVPPHAQHRQIGTLLRELHIEHSIGYKQALLALANRRFGRASPKRTAEVIARLLTAPQTACYLTHTPTPAGLWQEMHQIHAFAQASNLADTAVEDAPPANLAYSQALLIALADPPHMSHAELVHTRLYLDQFAARSMLTATPVAGHHGFPIRTDGDAAPNPFATNPTQGSLWIDTDALCHHLHNTAVRLHTGETPRYIGLPPGMESELSQKLCKRLLKQWSTGAQRAFKRYATPGSTVQMVSGVSAIHRLLEQIPQADRLEADEVDSLPNVDIESVFAVPVIVNATRWTVSNDSAAGLGLIGTPDAPLNLKVGDPLALRADAWRPGAGGDPLDHARSAAGRARRQAAVAADPAMWVRPARPPRGVGSALLFGSGALKQNDRLLLPRRLAVGMDADVRHPPHQYTLTFGRRLAHTPSFDLIDFTVFADEQP
jgi:hypothetical protein